MVNLMLSVQNIITKTLIPLAFALCLLYFFWGIVRYVKAAGSQKESVEGRKMIMWGIVGLFVAFSIWGIISLIKGELGIPGTPNPKVLNK